MQTRYCYVALRHLQFSDFFFITLHNDNVRLFYLSRTMPVSLMRHGDKDTGRAAVSLHSCASFVRFMPNITEESFYDTVYGGRKSDNRK